MTAAILIILGLSAVFGFGLAIGRCISMTNPSSETEIVEREAVIVCLVTPRLDLEA